MNRTPDSVAAPPLELLRGASLFLDFDGTPVDFTATRDAVVVAEQLRRRLATLQERLGERVAIITGRSASSVTPLRYGMNLVAKEYVAAQNPDDPGVLILSRLQELPRR